MSLVLSLLKRTPSSLEKTEFSELTSKLSSDLQKSNAVGSRSVKSLPMLTVLIEHHAKAPDSSSTTPSGITMLSSFVQP